MVLITASVFGSMNQMVGLLFEAATTVVSSPPVVLGTSSVPTSMSVSSAGAPAAPFPETPTSTTAMTPCPALLVCESGR